MTGADGGARPVPADRGGPREPARPERPGQPLRILQLEDDADDAELAQRLLAEAGLDFTAVVVDTRESFTDQLAAFAPAVILADHHLPGFSGESALEITRQRDPDVPFIILSGRLGDEAAVELLRRGVTDYVLKDRPARLPSVVRRAVAEAEQRARQAVMEAQLNRSRRLAIVARLAGGIAHEFNNQVGVMLNYAAFIREEAAARSADSWDKIRDDAEQIERAGERVIALIRQLLAVGCRESTHLELVDLNETVRGIEDLLRSTIGDGIEFRADLAAGLGAAVVDPARVRQVLLDLALNAGEAMPDGGSFSVETRNVTVSRDDARHHASLAPGAYVRLRIQDTGAGMTPDAIDHAFEPFYTTRPFVEGRGLGLAGVYGIVTQAGGTVDISSTPGAGTTVTAWLPAAPDEPPPADRAPAPRPAPAR